MEARSRRFTRPSLEGVTLHVLQRGRAGADPLVLLHGGGANGRWWDPLAEALAGRFLVTALDFRGHGDSDHPEALRVGAFSEDLAALIEELGGPPPVLVGHSLGGHVALDHAASQGGIRGLVLLDVARGADLPRREATRRALGIRWTYRTREQAVARFRFLPAAPRAGEATRRTIAEHSVREEPGGRFGFKFDPRWFGVASRKLPDLSGVTCPTLIVRGAQSELLTEAGALAWAREIPGAELRVVPDAGHHVHLEQPGAVLEALQEFLGRL